MGPGDLCSVEFDEGEYRVVKILAMGDGMVHVRLYADRFGERPFQVDPARLDQGATDKYFGIPHLPVSVENFATWRPGAIGHEDVRERRARGLRDLAGGLRGSDQARAPRSPLGLSRGLYLVGWTKTIRGAELIVRCTRSQRSLWLPSIVWNLFGPVRFSYMPMWFLLPAKFEPSRS